MAKIVVAQKTAAPVLNRLAHYGEVIEICSQDESEVREACKDAECLQIGTWMKVTADFLDATPALRVISRTGVGVDNVDVAAATARKILVLHTPGVNALSVAEHTAALILASAKHLLYLDRCVRVGQFQERRRYLPMDLSGKRLGLVGLGNVGKRVAELAHYALGMKVIAYDPFVTPTELYIQPAKELENVLRESDVISIHVPLLESTKNLIGQAQLEQMRHTAILVNTSRGGIVDEDALCQALQSGRIGGAALDVFENEPPDPQCPLFTLDNVILTPHAAALTKECAERTAMCAAEGIIDYLSGKTPLHVFNGCEP